MLNRNQKRSGRIFLSIIAMATMILSSVNVFAADDSDFDKYKVQGTNPQGTVVSLFDYWVDTQSSADFSPAYNANGGINKGKQLKFSTGQGNGQGKDFNMWTGSASPCKGMVSTTLENGYPKLAKNSSINSSTEQSLAYLFNQYDSNTTGSNQVAGKKAYTNVDGLMQVNDDGYYYYDSEKNYAAYNSKSNSFNLYNKAAVKYGNLTGQFFPFNGPSTVFNQSNGSISAKNNVTADSDTLNHWFGLNMTTHFVQPEGGTTTKGKDVTYEFKGDDDVWVFIDDVLVGDLGGIHDAASLNINFKSGEIKINGKSDGNLLDKYKAAGKQNTTEWEGSTFAGDTYHTLKFFYLERGNYASDMALKFNLKLMPDNEVKKVDQEGNPLKGAGFELYEAKTTGSGNDIKYEETGSPLCSGVTGEDGSLILTSEDGGTINFEELYKKGIGPDYILKETKAPEGYRKVKPVWLHFDSKTGAITSENLWSSGVSVNSRMMITAPAKIYDRSGNEIPQNDDGTLKKGSIFAVVYHRTGETINKDEDWASVSGSVLKGWKLHKVQGLDDILKGNRYELKLNSMGAYETTIDELPGDIMTYSQVILANNKNATAAEKLEAIRKSAKYSISYYYTTGDVKDATADNTTRLDTGVLSSNGNAKEYDYQYAVKMVMTDVSNDLYVQKTTTDATGFNEKDYCLDGVKFALYKESDTTLTSQILPGEPVLKEGATPYRVETTKTMDYFGQTVYGMAKFKSLPNGVYYLKEIEAPSGYKLNNKLIKVIANDGGTFADAGTKGDNIYVGGGGVGNLLKGMEQYANADDLDTTLTDTKANLRVSTKEPGLDGTWDPDATSLKYGKDDLLHLHYQYDTGSDKIGHYVPVDSKEGHTNMLEEVPFFTVDEGWPSSFLQQCETHDSSEGYSSKTNLGNLDLSGLFVLDVFVQMRDEAVGDLEISKTVKNNSSNTDFSDEAFPYSLKVWTEDKAGNKTPVTGTYKYTIQSKDGTSETKEVTLGEDGTSQEAISLKDGQKAVIKDLPAKAKYTVTEDLGDANYWDVTAAVDGAEANADKTAEGTIPAPADNGDKQKSTVDYVNTYSPAAAQVQVPVEKLFNGWNKEGLKTEFFKFSLIALNNSQDAAKVDTTMPEGSEKNENGYMEYLLTIYTPKDHTEDEDGFVHATDKFPTLTFTHAGTYNYTVKERTDSLPHLSYSNAIYSVKVTVTDDGKGKLTATSEITKEVDDDGGQVTKAKQTAVDAAAFKNIYDDKLSYVDLRMHKSYVNETGSDDLSQNQFRFKLEAAGDNKADVPMPGDMTERTVTSGNEEDGSIRFANMVFHSTDIGKTYLYKATEVMPEGATKDNDYTLAGTKYDPTVYYIQVIVGEAKGGAPDATFKYYLDEECTKEIKGSDSDTKNYFYQSNDGKYCLKFNNSYVAAPPIEVGFDGSKTLNGRDMEDGEFQYTIEPLSDVTKKAIADGSIEVPNNGLKASAGAAKDGETSKFHFPAMTFSKTGTYTFQIKEKVPEGAKDNVKSGVTYDSNVTTVTVKITDKDAAGQKTGKLAATVTYKNSKHDSTSGAEFVNQYKETGSAKITGSKSMTGRNFQKGDSYTFTITPKADAPAPKDEKGKTVSEVTINPTSGDKADIDFGTVTFNRAGETYKYTLKEKKPSGDTAGVTYDDTEYTVTLTSEAKNPKDGTLTIHKTITANDGEKTTASWTNSYKAEGSIPLNGTKTLTGRKWKESDSFTFTLWAKADNKTLLDSVAKDSYEIKGDRAVFKTVTVTGKDAGDKATTALNFGSIHFTKATSAGKPYEFFITETVPAANKGITFDDSDHRLLINVSDDGQGHLSARASEGSVEELNFTNMYSSTIEYGNQEAILIQKTLKGRDMTDGQFEFTVEALDSGSGDAKVSATAAASKFGFGQNQTKKVFTSTAAADGETASVNILNGEKVRFTQDDAGKTFSYKISETKGGADGYTNDTSEYQVDITISDDGEGVLSAETVVTKLKGATTSSAKKKISDIKVHSTDNLKDKKTTVIPFTNSYKGTGSLNGQGGTAIEATKTLTGRAMKKGEFDFTVTNAKDTGDEKTVVATGSNEAAEADKAGKVTFSEIKYTTEGLKADVAKGLAVKDGDTYIYQYNVAEDTGDLASGVTAKDAAFTITVKVTDKGDGTLETKVVYPEGADKLAFTNDYDTQELTIPMKGAKVLSAEDGAAVTPEDIAGKFEFKLSGQETTEGADKKDAPMPTQDGKEVTSAKNGKTGEVDFGYLKFQASDFEDVTPDNQGNRTRTFEYKVTESGSAAGVVNDSEGTKTVTLKVQYNTKEKSFHVEGLDGETTFTFVNAYHMEPKDAEADTLFPVTKKLTSKKATGRDMKEGEFQFAVYEVRGDEQVKVADGTNEAATAGQEAKVKFLDKDGKESKLTYDKPGEHDYIIREVIPTGGADLNTKYDETSYSVHVSVTDNKDGTLKVTTTSDLKEGETFTFVNKDTTPEPTPTPGPTPDPTPGPNPTPDPNGGHGGNGSGGHSGLINTGDDHNLGAFAILGVLALGGLVVVVRKRKDA